MFVGLSKAFDPVSHELLLQKLDRCGIRGTPLEWFRSFLTGRKQRVVVGGEESLWFDLHSGVPQGSILGPIHFSLFVNDLPASLARSEVMLYMRMIQTSTSLTPTLERLSQDLVALSTWIADNGLTTNTQKTQFMVLFKRGRDKEVEKLHIKVNGEVLRDGGPPTQLEGSRGSCWKEVPWRSHPTAHGQGCSPNEAEEALVPITDPSTLRLLCRRMG